MHGDAERFTTMISSVFQGVNIVEVSVILTTARGLYLDRLVISTGNPQDVSTHGPRLYLAPREPSRGEIIR